MIFGLETDHFKEPRPSALYRPFADESTANDWTVINGIAAARVYTDIISEYTALHHGTALVDLGIQNRYAIHGHDAAKFLCRLSSTPANDILVSESARGLILNSEGYVVDFCSVTRLSKESFLLTTSIQIDRRLRIAARGYDIGFDNITDTVAALGIFGPNALKTAAAAGFVVTGDTLASHGKVRGVEAFARPVELGHTSGIEIIFPAEEALTLWERVRRNNEIIAAGTASCEIVRIEAGQARPGIDFCPADAPALSGKRIPSEINAPHLAPLNRTWFNGRRAILDTEPTRELIPLVADADEVIPGTPVYERPIGSPKNTANIHPIGTITSAAFSPRYKAAICFADIPFDHKRRTGLLIGSNGTGHFTAIGGGGETSANRLNEDGIPGVLNAYVKTRRMDTPETDAALVFKKSAKKATERQSFFV
ncbi:MAG: hypothetical protein AAF720_13925 [Pseudomonadota bacterium]